MPFPAVVALFHYWASFPPVHILVAKYLGYKNKRKGELNRFERDAMPSPNAQLPPLPDYVKAAIAKVKANA